MSESGHLWGERGGGGERERERDRDTERRGREGGQLVRV